VLVPDFDDVSHPAKPFSELELEQRVLRAASASTAQPETDNDPRILAEVRVPHPNRRHPHPPRHAPSGARQPLEP
jgi:hypothetical protein